jgi:hypothetical protein
MATAITVAEQIKMDASDLLAMVDSFAPPVKPSKAKVADPKASSLANAAMNSYSLGPNGLRLAKPRSGLTRSGPVEALTDFDNEDRRTFDNGRGDNLTSQSITGMTVDRQAVALLRDVCVTAGDSHYVLDRDSGLWSNVGKAKNAFSRLRDQYCSRFAVKELHRNIPDSAIRYFLNGHAMDLDGVLRSPVASHFVKYRGRRFLNTGFAPVFPAESVHENSPETLQMVDLINRCVLNDHRPWPVIRAEIMSDQKTVAKWVWHWIANEYQNVGVYGMTMLILYSEENGTGKDTLCRVLSKLVNEANSETVSCKELMSSWSDFAVGGSLGVISEFNVSGAKMSVTDILKAIVANAEPAVRRRNVGSFPIAATMSFVATTNNRAPMVLDGSDRRFMMIECSEDAEQGRQIAGPINDWIRLALPELTIGLGGLASILASIQIDHDLIRKAMMTDMKAAGQALYSHPTDEWANEFVHTSTWRKGEFRSTNDLFLKFKPWAEDRNEKRELINFKTFSMALSIWAKRTKMITQDRKMVDGHRAAGYILTADIERESSFPKFAVMSEGRRRAVEVANLVSRKAQINFEAD